MRKFISAIIFAALLCSCSQKQDEGEVQEGSFVKNMQGRDTVLIADQLRFGAPVRGVSDGSRINLPPAVSVPGMEVVSAWKLDTLRSDSVNGTRDMEASTVVTSFEPGEYFLPAFSIAVTGPDGAADTLSFEGVDVLVSDVEVDTATFQIRPLKFQKTYPVTMREKLPYRLGLAGLILLCSGIYVFLKYRKKKQQEAAHVDPPHIIALRKLDTFRSDRFWTPTEQKSFYSGVTDALREYIEARFGIGAMEMTTAQIVDALKKEDIPDDLKAGLKSLFEDADFVKFAKGVIDDSSNAKVLPFGVNFVTSTYQEQLQQEQQEPEKQKEGKQDVL